MSSNWTYSVLTVRVFNTINVHTFTFRLRFHFQRCGFIKTAGFVGSLSDRLTARSRYCPRVLRPQRWRLLVSPEDVQLSHNCVFSACRLLDSWSLSGCVCLSPDVCGTCPATIRPCVCASVAHAVLFLSHESGACVHAYVCVGVCHQVTGGVSGLLFVPADSIRHTETFNKRLRCSVLTFPLTHTHTHKMCVYNLRRSSINIRC